MTLRGRRIVCLSSIPWHAPIRTSRHHLARILAEDNELLFVDPPRNLLRAGRADGGLHREPEGVLRLEPPAHLPYGGAARLAAFGPLNERRYARSVLGALSSLGWRRPLLWTTCPVPFAARLAERLEPESHLVHMTDALWHYAWYQPGLERPLRRLLATADRAAGTTPAIVERLAAYGVETHHLPHGIDADRFAPAALRQVDPPPVLAARDRPRIGFVGNIESRLDVDAVIALSRGPGSVTLLGPNQLDHATTERLRTAGAHLDGPVAYDELPRSLAAFDVAVLPYLPTPLVVQSRPLKLLEYLAAGLPVVAVDIPATRELAPHVVTVAGSDGYREAVDRLWAGRETDDAGLRLARHERALGHGWDKVANSLGDLLVGE